MFIEFSQRESLSVVELCTPSCSCKFARQIDNKNNERYMGGFSFYFNFKKNFIVPFAERIN